MGFAYSLRLLMACLISERVEVVVVDVPLRCDKRQRVDGNTKFLLNMPFHKTGPVSGYLCPAH